MRRLSDRLTYANVMATTAVFIALGGSSYAALKLPKNSVGAREIRTGAVRSSEIKDRSVAPEDLAASTRAALVGERGPQVSRGATGAVGASGPRGPAGPTYWAAVDTGGGKALANPT